MLKTYSVQYLDKNNQRTGTIVQAHSALDAKLIVEGKDEVKTLITYPKEI